MNVAGALQFGWGRRLPVMLQTEAAECGLVSLAMVASYHGRYRPIRPSCAAATASRSRARR